jgi:hypothetical protein
MTSNHVRRLPRVVPLARAAREILGIDRHEGYRLAREGKLEGVFKIGNRWFVSLPIMIGRMQGEEPDDDPFEGIIGR